MMDIYVSNKKIDISPQKSIGKGGEADVFDIGKGKVIKVFKLPTHPDYQGLPLEQKAASYRLQEHQQKLPQFPTNLPDRVIAPENLATDKQGNTIVGYTMPLLKGVEPLLRYSDRSFRTSNGLSNQTVIDLFQDLYETVSHLHKLQVVIGDFNDLNILISGSKAYLIDADSFQYNQFLCRVFTNRFVDPLLCNPQENKPILTQAHNFDSDWYAFTVILMQCLLFVDPYGGVYQPKNKQDKIPHTARFLKRITVFHPEVRYPKPAIPYQVLPDDLLQYFHRCFEKDQRGIFPRQLLDNLQWKKCINCGLEYARFSCPNCTKSQAKLTLLLTITVRGNVTATTIFSTEGVILNVIAAQEQLHWLYHEKEEFKRENKSVIFTGELNQRIQFWLQGESTLVGKQGQIITFGESSSVNNSEARLAVDSYQDKPIFQCNSLNRYWIYGGQLFRDTSPSLIRGNHNLGSEYIGDVLQNQTQFWVGSHFGFGFYRAGNLNVAFIFYVKRRGINDKIKFPNFSGQLIEATCTFSSNYCWVFLAIQEQGIISHRLCVINSKGEIIAIAEAEKGDNSWLSSLQGKCAVGNFLLVATNEGIIRLEPHNGQIIKTKEFPDTESFVDDTCQLLAAAQGLYIVSQKQITLLQIKAN